MDNIRVLEHCSEITMGYIGGKARNLVNLSSFTNVPPFVVIVDNSQSGIDASNSKSLFGFDKFETNKLYAVRSSANVEDGADNAFAGMFESILSVESKDIFSAIERVFKSANTDRVNEYLEVKKSSQSVYLSVVVQEMIDSDSSGVVLSFSPSSNDEIIIEAIFGLGELLVSGLEEPDRWIVDRERETVLNYKSGRQICLLSNGGKKQINPTMQVTKKLNAKNISMLIALTKKIEQKLGIFPVDIEFAVKDDVIYVLQARPLTSRFKK